VAIVLINPPPDSAPLELSATVFKDKPRQVTLVDSDGEPVVGVQTRGMTFYAHDIEPPLRSATFFLSGLNPDRTRRITFIEKRRGLVGSLLARSDGEAPCTIVMRHWGAVIGRILGQDGKPTWANLWPPINSLLETSGDAEQGTHANIEMYDEGRFRIDELVPGQRYTVEAFAQGHSGLACENLVVSPGERRDLGSIRIPPPVDQQKK
jgi:hypothetical protein